MARSKTTIKAEITKEFMANETLAAKYDFAVGALFESEFSLVSLENIIFEIIAMAIYVHELLFDTHKKEVDDLIEAKMPHRPSWYRTKAKDFQYGFALIDDTDKYDNTGFTDEQVEASKIIKYAAVTQSAGDLLIKIAAETGGVLAPISAGQKEAFDAYINEVADAGVKYFIFNLLPDKLYLNIQIFRNPLVLDNNGLSIKNANYPVEDAIKAYMKELPFNGELVLAHLIDKIQEVEGVTIPHLVNAEFQTADSNGIYGDKAPITVKTIAASGYFTLPNFDDITYVT